MWCPFAKLSIYLCLKKKNLQENYLEKIREIHIIMALVDLRKACDYSTDIWCGGNLEREGLMNVIAQWLDRVTVDRKVQGWNSHSAASKFGRFVYPILQVSFGRDTESCWSFLSGDYMLLSRRLARCDRVIQNESSDPNGGNMCSFSWGDVYVTSQCKWRSLRANPLWSIDGVYVRESLASLSIAMAFSR